MNLDKHPKCELGHPYVVRTNKSTNEKFWGCVMYPEHISTIQIPYCSNNHPMKKLRSQHGEYFKCRNEDCRSTTYHFEPQNSKYHAQLINLSFKEQNYNHLQITEPTSDDDWDEFSDHSDVDDNKIYNTHPYETWKDQRKRELKEALNKIKEQEKSDNFKEYGIRETNEEKINRILTDHKEGYKEVLKNANNELIDFFEELWNNPQQQIRFIKIKPDDLLGFLNLMIPKPLSPTNKFMPWNRGY